MPPPSHEAYVGLLYLLSPLPGVFRDIAMTIFDNKKAQGHSILTYSFISSIYCMDAKAMQIV